MTTQVTTHVRLRDLRSNCESQLHSDIWTDTKSVDLKWAKDETDASVELLKTLENGYKNPGKPTPEERKAVDARLYDAFFGDKRQFPESAKVLEDLGIRAYDGAFSLNEFQRPYTRFSAWVDRFLAERGIRKVHLTKVLQTVILGQVFQQHLDAAMRNFVWRPGGEGYNSLLDQQGEKRPRSTSPEMSYRGLQM